LAEGALGGPVVLYALADLDAELRFRECWLALGEESVAVVAAGFVSSFPRSAVTAVSSEAGLSSRVLRLHAGRGEGPLAALYLQQRQRRAIDAIAFVLEQALEGRQVTLEPADAAYR